MPQNRLGFDLSRPALSLGLRQNWFQFSVLAGLTFLVGMTVGVERVALPPLAKQAFGITSFAYTAAFISAFGVVKATMNLVAGGWSDRIGRRPLLLCGWLVGLPFPVMIILAPSWLWVLAANLLLGMSQALAWTMTVTAKIDLVGPRNRGLAVGINEFSGYAGVAAGGYAGALLVTAFGLRPAPYLLALGVLLLGTAGTLWPARETLPWARFESSQQRSSAPPTGWGRMLARVTWGDRALFAACQAGLVEKFADTLVWAFVPLHLLRLGLSPAAVGVVVGVYGIVWGALQIPSGALADRVGRKLPIACGMLVVGAGIAFLILATSFLLWLSAAAVMGLGMALLYPNLISAVSDVADPSWRGAALGVYRFWRDAGYAVGALAIGAVADLLGLAAGFWFVASLMVASGLLVAALMYETAPHLRRLRPASLA